MSTSEHTGEDQGGRNALVAEYVLGLLDTSEHERIGRLIENDAALRRERDFWVSRFGALNREYEETAVPAHIFNAIEARAFGDRVKSRGAASFWDSLMLWRALAGGALAVAVTAVGFNLLQPAQTTASLANQLVAALQEDGSDVKFVALYDGGTGMVRLTALSGDAAADKDFELWAIQGDGKPRSMGVIAAHARSEVGLSAEIAAGWGEGSVLAITLEPKGGSPSGDPTGPVIAKGAVTRI
ncbi:anti-sigma factor domain-containing protein [uncultured Devosia sp.]|uniref:anti-sigma factor n=1 Tax=uncultured Devosia sp. TaxID=211434 RepID=UPI0035CB6026